MAGKVKRPNRRSEQAAETRRRVVSAAAQLFQERGYATTSMVSIADAAGVAPETIYKAFGTKRRILQDVIDSSVVGTTSASPVPVLRSATFQAIRAEPDQRARVAMLAHLTRTILERAGPIHAVIRSAAATDPDIAALRLEQQAYRLKAQIEFVRVVAEAGPLRPGLTLKEAGYQYWILATPEIQHILVTEQGWSQDRYESWLRATLEAVLLP